MPEQTNISHVNNKRIAKNTIMLYMRQVLIMLIGLYTVRVVLKTLGIEDYGVYNVVSGAVTMFGFLSGAMALGSQRFFSYYIGKGDNEGLKKTFQNTLSIYLVLAIIIVILGESIGLWFINTKLVIPESRMFAANCIFQISIVSFVLSMMSAPFMASIISHEQMGVYAKVGIIEVLLKLMIVFVLVVLPFDKLICYGLLLLAVSIITFSIYIGYCKKRYDECCLQLKWDSVLIKDIASFSGWNLFGNFAWIVKNQGTSFMLNMFCGPSINAAQNLATQVRGVVNTFASNFTSAVQPQLVKSYAKNDYQAMFRLMGSSCKLSFLLMVVFAIPVILNVDYLLHIWLVEVPDYAVSFTQIMLIEATLEAMSTPTASVNQATGKIKYYQMIIGILGMINLPISYCFLRMGYPPDMVYFISLILQSMIVLHRIFFLERIQRGISISVLKHIFLPCIIAGMLSYFVCYLLYSNIDSFVITILTCFYEVVIVMLACYFIALNRHERAFILSNISTVFKKIKREN